VIAEPPSKDGAVKAIEASPFPSVATKDVGASGVVRGVPETTLDAGPDPAMFTARNLMPYDTPFINIGITTGETVMGGLGTIHEPEST